MSIATKIQRIETIRNRIRTKLVELGISAPIDKLEDLTDGIENIVNHGTIDQTLDAGTAGADDVLTGKIIVGPDGTVTPGNMPNIGGVTKALDVTTVTYVIPKGFHSGTGKVTITLETKTVTPTKKQQKITPTEGKVLSEVTVEPIPDAYQDVTPVTAGAADVLSGKKIVSETGEVVDGAIPVNGDVSATIDGLTTTSCTIPAGHTTGGTVSLTSDIEDALAAI